MAIFLSDLMTNGAAVVHSPMAGQQVEITGNIRIPAGTDLANTDKILVARWPATTIFDEIIVAFPVLDDDGSPALTLDVGYDRPVVDPRKPYNATTNPYITGAIGTADPDFFEAVATTAQAGGTLRLAASGFTVTSSPQAAGLVDVSITPVTGADAAITTDRTINFTIRGVIVGENQAQGAFSGASAYDYNTNITL